MTRIIAFAGSLRRDSFNRKLVRVAASGAADAGSEIEVVDLADYPLAVFDQDLEEREGLPTHARALKDLFIAADGILISSPEYNGSISAALKNTLDWVSRPVDGEAPMAPFKGKVAGLVAASPGALGGLRGLVHLRAILGNLGMIVLPDQVAVGRAHGAFDADGGMTDAKVEARVLGVGRRLSEVASRLQS